jgi:hypothetical protein
MCGERRRDAISLEKPKDGIKKREGEQYPLALPGVLILLSININTVI